MIAKRVMSSSVASRSLSFLLKTQLEIFPSAGGSHIHPTSIERISATVPTSSRFFSSTGGSDRNKNIDGDKVTSLSDPFGVSFEDGEDQLGPRLPPKYKRDVATGKLTGDVEAELTAEEREILRMDPLERDKLLLKRLVKSWDAEKKDEATGDPKALADFARRVRLAKMSLNVLGRSVTAQGAKTTLDSGEEFGRDKETGFTQHLTRSEFDAFQKFMKDKHNTEVTEEDIPVHDDDAAQKGRQSRWGKSPLDDDDIHLQGITAEEAVDPDNPDLSLKWLTSRANWEVNRKYGEETPFDDMLPRDLNLSRIVNRKRAKILPRELLHHNNLALLRRYVSPAGQIMHRVRTRLGARDQRKVSKLIKRARNLGLIPHSGQFVIEDNGNIHEKDIHEMKPWEEELLRRGLTVAPKKKEA